jgi:glutamate-1-semialdehyde aminotransferase/acyl carrier protein
MSAVGRRDRIIAEIRRVIDNVTGEEIDPAAVDVDFYSLGLDSLVLTQVALELGKRLNLKLKLRNLAEDYQSCGALAAYLDAELPPGMFAETAAAQAPAAAQLGVGDGVAAIAANTETSSSSKIHALPSPAAEATARPLAGGIRDILQQQLALMAAQIQLLSGESPRTGLKPAEIAPAPSATPKTAPPADRPATDAAPSRSDESLSTSPAEDAPTPGYRHGPQLVLDRSQGEALTPTQEKHIDRLIERYVARTGKSKAFTARNRHQVADPRTASGFRPRLKEMVYPIVAERSSGCRIWDLDGNEYIDLLSGYGSNFFGFGAPFVREAIIAQLEQGMEIGPQTYLVEEVATLFRQFVPMDRIAFCNTGSEAVLAALRMARTATGRDLVVMFSGGYHGIFDEVVVRPTKRGSRPAAPGIPATAVGSILVLPWAESESLEIIRSRADEIAAVLVEPVQSRAPHIQPAEFLQSLRQITEQSGSALIFDEVVTGFRVAPGGAQEYFGIEADIATYGKVPGGGLSIGIAAGKREFMDALDGGGWEYGDASIPEVGVTYFAGTFVRHPVHLAATRATLRHMLSEGPDLQRRISGMAERFAGEVNTFLRSQQAPLEIRRFASVLKIAQTEDVPFGEIVFAHLREWGVHVWDGRPSFFNAAHGEAEVRKLVDAFKGAVTEMQEGGFYPGSGLSVRSDDPPVPGARLGRDPSGNPTWYVPDPDSASGYKPIRAAS